LGDANRSYSSVHEIIRRALYPAGHPYHDAPTLRETLASLDAIELDDVRKFFRDHYGAGHATMVLAGDVDDRRAKTLVNKYFAALPGQREAHPRRDVRPIVLDHEVVLRIEAQVDAPVLVLAWPTPAAFAPDDAELDVLAALLSRGGGQLGWQLIEKTKIASSIQVRQASRVFGSRFIIEAVLQSAGDFDRAISTIDLALDKLRADAAGTRVTEQAKAPWQMTLLFRNESLSGRTSSFLSYRREAGEASFLGRDLARYLSVNQEGIQRVAHMLQRNNRVVAKVIPAMGAPVGGVLMSP
jgi:zinc protease